MRTYSLYLSTLGNNRPLSKTNLSQLKWSVNWQEIFGKRDVGECKCRIRFLTASSANLTWPNNVGSVRASFQSNTSNSSNGFNLGAITPQTYFITSTTLGTYLDADTSMSNGVSMIIPKGNADFYITLLNSSETLMLNMQEYQIWLYFDVDE